MEIEGTIHIFYCYAQEDKALYSQLETHLSILRQQKRIASWSEQEILPGLDIEEEVRLHLNSAQLLLLLVSPHFLASERINVIINFALERYNAQQTYIIPIILRPVDWESSLFQRLKVLPENKLPITLWSNRDKAFLDVVKGIRKAIDNLPTWLKEQSEQRETLCRAYCERIYNQWKMLDFKGIQYSDINRPLSIPLMDVFVPSSVLRGVPEYETLERDQVQNQVKSKEKEHRFVSTPYQEYKFQRERQTLQREEVVSLFTRHKRLVILGDPGAGKSTLLRYFLLTLSDRMVFSAKNSELSFLENFPEIPLYIPLSSFAESWLSSTMEERSLKDFLPKYLHYIYLDDYIDVINEQLKRGKVLLLLDGLDEIPDVSVRMRIVKQIEYFTQAYSQNYFIVTSRIVGYKDAPLATEYQTFTLADFNDEQIKSFTQKWCPAYERWVNQVNNSQLLEAAATKEAEKLYQATRQSEDVKRLATNPLLLTILALVQRQGIELPGHRVELFDLCATTLLETWLRTKISLGTALHSVRFSKQNLIKILRPLAFWMHNHPAFGAISEEAVCDQVAAQALGKLTRYQDEAQQFATEFLEIVRGRAGILIERGRNRYGFLHMTFEEYFAAEELVLRKDKDVFIRCHLHDPQWRVVILLAVGIIGVLRSDEEEVTRVVQEDILNAHSPFEEWLHRDLLFAGFCVADEVGMSIVCEEYIIYKIIYLYLTSPYNSHRVSFLEILSMWKQTPLAAKACNSIVSLQITTENSVDLPLTSVDNYSPLVSFAQLERDIAAYSKQLLKRHLDSLVFLLRLNLYMIVGQFGFMEENWVKDILIALSDDDLNVRKAGVDALVYLRKRISERDYLEHILDAARDKKDEVKLSAISALGNIDIEKDRVIDLLLNESLQDEEMEIRKAAVVALGKVGSGQERVILALLRELEAEELEIRQAAAGALGQVGNREERTITVLLQKLEAEKPEIRQTAALALGQVGNTEGRIITVLLQKLEAEELEIRRAAVMTLGQLGQGNEIVITPLLDLLSAEEWEIRQAAASALGHVGSSQEKEIEALMSLLNDDSWRVRQAAIESLGKLGQAHPKVLDVLLYAISQDFAIQQAAIKALGNLGNSSPRVIEALLDLLSGEDTEVQQAAIKALNHLGNSSSRVMEALFGLLTEMDVEVQQAAIKALGNLGNSSSRVMDLLFENIQNPSIDVRRTVICALSSLEDGFPRIVEVLLQMLVDPLSSLRQAAVDALQRLIKRRPEIVQYLLDVLSDHYDYDSLLEPRLAKQKQEIHQLISTRKLSLLGQLGSGQAEVVDILLQALTEGDVNLRYVATLALGQQGKVPSGVVNALLQMLADTSSYVRQAAAGALGSLGCGSQEVIEALLQTLVDSSAYVQQAAARSLGLLGNGEQTLLERLLKGLINSSPYVRQASAEALVQQAGKRTKVRETILEELRSSEASMRQAAALALEQLGTGQLEVIEALLQTLNDENWAVKRAVISTLGRLGGNQPKVINALLDASAEADASVRQAAASALGRSGQRQATIIETLLKQLSDPDWSVRQAAIEALGELGNDQPFVVEALLQALTDSSPYVRQVAALVLGHSDYRRPEVISALLATIVREDSDVKRAAIEALGQLGNAHSEAIEMFCRMTTDASSYVRQAAVIALGKVSSNGDEIIEILLKRLGDTDWAVRQAVVIALGQLGNGHPKGVTALLSALEDSSSFVRQAAIEAFTTLAVDSSVVGSILADSLSKTEATAKMQLIVDDITDAQLIALKCVVGDG